MTLKPGDSGAKVKVLQRGLDRLGALLLIDGDYGPGTVAAVKEACIVFGRPAVEEADDALQNALANLPELFPPLRAPGVTFIARAEVSGAREYRLKYAHPIWPSPQSGITIGIGYDLKFVDRVQLNADWGAHLSANAIKRLAQVSGAAGSKPRLAQVASIEIALNAAMTVFVDRTLPEYVEKTRAIYPQLDALTPARRSALVSLVYNRGNGLTDRDPVRQERREMRAIKALLAAGDLEGVDEQIDAMARLWDPMRLPGLIQRRHDEARLWRSGFAALQLD